MGASGPAAVSRRHALRLAGLALASVCTTTPGGPAPAFALRPGKPSKERLLNSLRKEKTPEEIEADRERVAEERRQRLERQRELQQSAERRKAGLEDDSSKNTEIESNLRGQYYFPTARKRYLPRVKLAWDSIPDAEDAARTSRWSVVTDMSAGILGDAVLPMKLYASALAGGGLSINSSFIEKMTGCGEKYEGAVKKLAKASKKKDTGLALNSLTEMRSAIAKYRELGRLEADDFGVGEMSEGTRVGSGFGNNSASLYQRNKGSNGSESGPMKEVSSETTPVRESSP